MSAFLISFKMMARVKITTPARHILVAVVGLGVIVIAAVVLRSETRDIGAISSRTEAAIQVDIRPFFPREEFTGSLSVGLDKSGKAIGVNYLAGDSLVLEVREGTFPGEAVKLFAVTETRDFQRALENNSSKGNERMDGDVFGLLIRGPTNRKGYGGVLATAPTAIQHVADGLIALWPHLTEKKTSAAYLRGQDLQKELADQVRREGKERFLKVADFSQDVQAVVQEAANHPYNFISLDEGQAENLRKQGRYFLVVAGDAAYQMNLFNVRTGTAEKRGANN